MYPNLQAAARSLRALAAVLSPNLSRLMLPAVGALTGSSPVRAGLSALVGPGWVQLLPDLAPLGASPSQLPADSGSPSAAPGRQRRAQKVGNMEPWRMSSPSGGGGAGLLVVPRGRRRRGRVPPRLPSRPPRPSLAPDEHAGVLRSSRYKQGRMQGRWLPPPPTAAAQGLPRNGRGGTPLGKPPSAAMLPKIAVKLLTACNGGGGGGSSRRAQ
jgi:hypothetical protein